MRSVEHDNKRYYESVAIVKKEKLKMVHLEKEFGKHRTDQSDIFCVFVYF